RASRQPCRPPEQSTRPDPGSPAGADQSATVADRTRSSTPLTRTGDRRVVHELVHLLGHGPTGVRQSSGAERLVDLDEPAVGQPADDAGLDTVREHLAVVLL